MGTHFIFEGSVGSVFVFRIKLATAQTTYLIGELIEASTKIERSWEVRPQTAFTPFLTGPNYGDGPPDEGFLQDLQIE